MCPFVGILKRECSQSLQTIVIRNERVEGARAFCELDGEQWDKIRMIIREGTECMVEFLLKWVRPLLVSRCWRGLIGKVQLNGVGFGSNLECRMDLAVSKGVRIDLSIHQREAQGKVGKL